MIKPIFGVKNILVVIINIPLILIFLMYIWAGGNMLLGGNISAFFMILPAPFLIYYFVSNIKEQICPKYFKCMQAVTKYIKYKDLRELLRDEKFIEFEFPQDIVEILRRYGVKAKHYEVQFSQNWIYAEGVYIPKKMVWGTSASEGVYNRLDKMMFELIDDEEIQFGCFHRCCGIPGTYFDQGIEIPTIKNKRAYSKKKFKEAVKTREDFLNFLKED